MIILARWLSVEDYASLALTMALVGYLVYVAGLDFYVSAHREFLSRRFTLDQVVKAQALVLAAGLTLAAPLLWLLLADRDGLARIAAVTGLLIGEAVCAELSRLLIVVGRPTVANVVNFLKAAGWMLPVLIAGPWMASESMLSVLYAAWGFGLLIACSLGLWGLRLPPGRWLRSGPTADLIRRHVRVMPTLVAGTLALRAVFSLDRVFVEWAQSATLLAPYALFAGMGAAFMALVDAGVVARLYPSLVTAIMDGKLDEARHLKQTMFARTAALIALMAATLWLGLDLLLEFIGRVEYSEQAHLAWIVAAAYACHALSMPFHFILYGLSRDRLLTRIHLAAAVLLCLLGVFAALVERGDWVAWAVLTSFLYMMIHKCSAATAALGSAHGSR